MSRVNTLEELRALKPQIEAITSQYGLKDIRVFGSIVRGEMTEESDIDLLVEWQDRVGLWKLFDCQYQIEEIVNREVELVDPRYIKYRGMKEHILAEAAEL